MKFADEITANNSATLQPSNTNNQFLEALDALQKKHDAQISSILHAINQLNSTLQKHITLSSSPTINTLSTIPSLNPVANPTEMLSSVKTVQLQVPVTQQPLVQPVVELEQVEEVEVEEVEEEVEVEVEEEAEEEVEVEEEVEEEEAEVEVEEEAEVEVEEWTYKGLSFFKDSNNIVYSNEDGDVGEPIGKYDPLKKVLKKL